MVVYPKFILKANGIDVTSHIKNNLISLTLDDRDGLDSDELSLVVAGIYQRPFLGDTVRLSLGANDKVYDYGEFKVQTTAIDYMQQTTEIRATAVDFSGTLKERRSQLWEALTLADIAQQIALNNGLSAIIDGAEQVKISTYAQNDISDLVFMRTLANEYGFLCVIKDNTIILKQKGIPENYSMEIVVDKKECTALNIERAAKNAYGSCYLSWQDIDTASMQKVIAGQGTPVYYLRNKQPKNPLEAMEMASAKLNKLNQGTLLGSLALIGGRRIRAGAKLILKGAEGDNGFYHIDGVTHNISPSGYLISIEFSAIKEVK